MRISLNLGSDLTCSWGRTSLHRGQLFSVVEHAGRPVLLSQCSTLLSSDLMVLIFLRMLSLLKLGWCMFHLVNSVNL